MLAQEAFAILLVAEGFSPARTSDRQSACAVATGQTGGQVGSAQILVQESGIEAVTGAHRVDCSDLQPRAGKALGPALRERTFAAQFGDDEWNHLRQALDCDL